MIIYANQGSIHSLPMVNFLYLSNHDKDKIIS